MYIYTFFQMSVSQSIGRNGSGRLDVVYAPIFINIFIYTYVYTYTYANVGPSIDQSSRVGSVERLQEQPP